MPAHIRPSPRPQQLSALLGELLSHIHRRSAGDSLAIMTEAGLTMAQLVTLHTLAHGGARSVGGIGGCLRLSPAATSHLVERLVRSRLVARTEDPDDRRARRVAITASGRRLVERVNAARTRELGAVFGRLTSEARRQLALALARVRDEIAALPQEPS